MLTTNIWIEAGLVNGAIGELTDIIYKPGTRPPNIPMYVVIHFENYSGPPWNQDDPKCVPIVSITLGSWKQIPIAMSWAITINKS